MAEHLTDDEQKQLLKSWWKSNGNSLIASIAIVAAAYFGWQWWQNSQKQYAEQAANLYSELTEVLNAAPGEPLSDEKSASAAFLIKQLQDDYASSLYAINASLQGAKLAVDAGDLDKAASQLQWVIAKNDPQINKVAKLRLARVYFAQENYDQALSQAAYSQDDDFSALYAEMRGDILVAQGDEKGAKAAYQQASDKLEENSQRRVLDIKLSNLASEDAS